jgi:hypothetical protein
MPDPTGQAVTDTRADDRSHGQDEQSEKEAQGQVPAFLENRPGQEDEEFGLQDVTEAEDGGQDRRQDPQGDSDSDAEMKN